MNPTLSALWAAIYCSQQSDMTQDNRRTEPETGDVHETSYWYCQNCMPLDGYTNSIPTIQIKNCLGGKQ